MTVNGAMTTRQIYNLRWNNHTNNMLQVFLEQLASEKLVDVTLSCEGKFLRVHKIVLSACSPYFQELFEIHKEQSPVIILNNMKYDDLKSVVNFMYCGEIEVAESQMEGVLGVAEALQVKGLSDVRDSYESGQKKARDKDGDGGGEVRETSEEKQNKPAPSKKRKLEEKVHEKLSLRTESETKTAKKDNSTKEARKKLPPEESKHEWIPDTIIKEETLDIDADDLEGSDEEVELALDWTKEAEKAQSSNSDNLVIDESMLKEDDSETVNNNEQLSTSENELLPIITQVVGMTNKHLYPSKQVTLENSTRKTGQEKIPRPPNAFMVFATEWRKKLALIHHGEDNKDISVRLGAMWKKLPPDTKEMYFAAARRADEEHKLRYPGYIYNPKEARLRKVLRQVAYKNSKVPVIAHLANNERDAMSSPEKKQPAPILPKPTEMH